jgi:hypothetical protein
MQVELLDQEAELLRLLLVKELEETRVEVHHARNMEYKAGLVAREGTIRALLEHLGAKEHVG